MIVWADEIDENAVGPDRAMGQVPEQTPSATLSSNPGGTEGAAEVAHAPERRSSADAATVTTGSGTSPTLDEA
jgi:hypothetical protein